MSNPIRDAIETSISTILSQSGRSMPAWDDDLSLSEDLKLDSLDLAQMVVRLEGELGRDPFRTGSHPVRTLRDLVELYAAAEG
ncbi:MAG: acyl carrier protein [Planctomycetota bacterium]